MERPSPPAARGRLVLLAVAGIVGASLVTAGRPATGAAAGATPGPDVPSTTVPPMPSPSARNTPAPSASPSVAPTPAVTPGPTQSPSPTSASAPAPTPQVDRSRPYPAQCVGWSPARERADLLLANRYRINVHPAVRIPADPTWRENPLDDDNWEYQFHSQWLVLSLLQSFDETGDRRYLDKAARLLRDWWEDNGRGKPRSSVAWDRMGTALRAQVLACSAGYLPLEPWLAAALDRHGQLLAGGTFYVGRGNWALNQDLGLLEVGIVRGRDDWTTLARDRLGELFEESIDAQGVTNEQSVYYQLYNHDRYRLAFGRLAAAGLALPASAARMASMPAFLARATLPNGEYEMIGDLDRMSARVLPGTGAEFSATKGAKGTRPTDTVAVYRAGWLFARSGWGERRAWADETALSLRWGPAPIIHGHADAGSITLYGYGARLLVDPGKYTYNLNEWRRYFKGRTAHNVVTVDGVAYDRTISSALLDHSRNATMVTARVRMLGNPGVTHVRGVTYSRNLDYVLVDDRLTSARIRTYRQLWHLPDDGRPDVHPTHFRTRRQRGNVQVRQLIGAGTTSRVVTGRTSPVQGWVAWEHGRRVAAPVVEVIRKGRNVRFLTLIVTAPGTPASGVSELKLTPTGYSVRIKIGSRYERVVVDGSKTTITPLD